MERKSVSVRSKTSYPSGDPQQKKVYEFDSLLENIINNHDEIKNNQKKSNDEYLLWANTVFKNEGFNDIDVKNNGSKRVSLINIDKQILSFSRIAIDKNDYETILHELAHGVCKYHYGYSYKDGHNELFVNLLINLINEKLNINKSEMYKLADHKGVKYFYDLNIKKNVIDKDIYDKMISNFNDDKPIYNHKSKKESFESKTFVKGDVAHTFFKNSENFYLYTERLLFNFEKDLFINPFINNRQIKNYLIVSPFIKVYKDGSISKSGTYFSYSYINFEKAKKNDRSIGLFQIKESASLDKNKIIKKHKNNGFIILRPKTIEQYVSIKDFYQKTINKTFA